MRTLVPVTLYEETAIDESVESASFRANPNQRFTLDLQANHGAGTQNLVGKFYLRHRVDTDADMERVDGYDFPDGPTATAFRYVESFEGASAIEYDVEFVYTSGAGDLTIKLHVPGGIL